MATFMELTETPQMLPPPPGSFIDREELIQHVGEYAISQGYVVTIKQSKKDKVVVLGCDRGGVYRNRRKTFDEASGGHQRQRKSGSRLTNCPFELVGKKEDGLWVLTVKNGSHNHEALKDFSEHPTARRFSDKEVMLIKEMTEAGLKPRQILKRLRQSNPDLLSTPKHLYNVKAKLRQGNLTVRRFKTLTAATPADGNCQPSTSSESSWRKHYPPRVPNLIGGRFVDSQTLTYLDVLNPATQQVVAQVPLTTGEELRAAVFAAKRAFPLWRNTPMSSRQHIMFKLQELIRRDIDKLAFSITTEQGKTLKDAYSDVCHGLEAVEFACGMASLQKGEFVSNASNRTDTFSIREPLGVCAGICPFNFPATVPLWMFPIAVTCGNTFILKPSELCPGVSMLVAELALEAGLPNGVLNIVHGTNDIVNAICDNDDIKVVSLVGSEVFVKYIHERPSANEKCVQANIGVKNQAIIMPDANMDATLNALVSACFGAGGQKFMAISTAIFVGCSKSWEDKLVERAKALKVNAGGEPGADLGPLVSKQVKECLSRSIQTAVDGGARLVLDGRQIVVPRYELGNFVGPTILSDVTEDMACYKEETFGPLLLCMPAGNLDEAICILNRNKNAFGASIFTTSASAARKFQTEIDSGQVGINCGVPAPMPFIMHSSSKASFSGDLNSHGKLGVSYYTRIKTVTQQWKDFPSTEGASEALVSGDLPSYEAPMALQSNDFPSNDGISLPTHSRDFSNGDGVSLCLQSKGFLSSDGDSLGEHSNDITESDGLPSAMPSSDHLNWTLNFEI